MASQKWLTEAVAELREKIDELTKRVDKVEKRNEVGIVGGTDGVVLIIPGDINPTDEAQSPPPVAKPKPKRKPKPAVKPAPAKQS